MKERTVHIGCVMTESEYERFRTVCNRVGTYPSAGLRFAANFWMKIAGGESLDGNGVEVTGNHYRGQQGEEQRPHPEVL